MLQSCESQENNSLSYQEKVKQAFEAYQKKNYVLAARLNTEAYKNPVESGVIRDKSTDGYNAACCWAKANMPDSAFLLLFDIANKDNYSDWEELLSDDDLKSLKNDTRWDKLISLVKSNSPSKDKKDFNQITSLLEDVYDKDQGLRQQVIALRTSSNKEHDSIKLNKVKNEMLEKIALQDKENLEIIVHILDSTGWPNVDQISFKASQAIFLVIQHASLDIQKKYLPLIEKAVQEGKTLPSNLAILEDRVALREGREQIYGSQIWTDPNTGKNYVDFLNDPLNVDTRRSKMGLPPMKEYLKQFFNLDWNANLYVEQILPQLKILKQRKPDKVYK